jgi:hypothetical protein
MLRCEKRAKRKAAPAAFKRSSAELKGSRGLQACILRCSFADVRWCANSVHVEQRYSAHLSGSPLSSSLVVELDGSSGWPMARWAGSCQRQSCCFRQHRISKPDPDSFRRPTDDIRTSVSSRLCTRRFHRCFSAIGRVTRTLPRKFCRVLQITVARLVSSNNAIEEGNRSCMMRTHHG